MTDKKGWLARLRQGLSRSSDKIASGVADVFTKRKLDEESLAALEDVLIEADLGPSTAARLVADFGKARFGAAITDQEVRQGLADQIAALLENVARPLARDEGKKPFVVLVVGVNGAGKTTTIGKMAARYVGQGLKVKIAAGDTFRAAAVEQLVIWGQRAGCEVMTAPSGHDAAALVFQSFERARAEKTDVLLIDTAGRLHNKKDLMEELSKISRVLKKLDDSAPHAVVLVLDATTGQNAFTQVKMFGELVSVTGLVVTKLDGSAKGGVLVGLADQFKLPVYAIGVGEGLEDLQPFDARDFARSLMGL
ncbi:MAG: signal recognition particle-docking protein FtsY [Alphaproteobacteria bacterium]|nr:signal recognition particle-docking protein FtsY [Alphaproteobacteria bacterium]